MTDGLQSYRDAIAWELPNSQHVRVASIRDKVNNNKVERLHNTIREKEKIMRGFKNQETAQILLDGHRAWYNFVRLHMALDMTPAEKANLKLELGKNKWLSLIEHASKQKF